MLNRNFLVLSFLCLYSFFGSQAQAHPDVQTCSICVEDIDTDEITTSCGHSFHAPCLREYVDYNFKQHLATSLIQAHGAQGFQDYRDPSHTCPLCRDTLCEDTHGDGYKFPHAKPTKRKSALEFKYDGKSLGFFPWKTTDSPSVSADNVEKIWNLIGTDGLK